MSTTDTARNLERFTIDVDQDVLDDLPARLKATRFAPDLDDDEVYGLNARYISPPVQYWADGDPRRISAHWKAERSLLPDVIRRPATLAVPLHLARRGGFRPRPVRQLSTFGAVRALAVPGRPLAIAVPGHTMGSTACVFPGHGVIFAGDALVTYDGITGRTGPRLAARGLTQDSTAALGSLATLAAHATLVVPPCHGQPHTGGLPTPLPAPGGRHQLAHVHSRGAERRHESSTEVQRAACRVTASDQDKGFANAVERLVLP